MLGINHYITTFTLALLSSVTLASPAQYSKDSITGNIGTFSAFFESQIGFSRTCFGIPINLNCTLLTDIEVSQSTSSPDEIIFSITSFEMTEGGTMISCDDFLPDNLPWTGYVSHSDLPVSPTDTTPFEFIIDGVELLTFCGTCSGSLRGTFMNTSNGDISLINAAPMAGTCSLYGTGTSPDHEYRIWHP